MTTYRLFYAIGAISTAATVALLGWVAFCIAIEAEPLTSIAFLPSLPVWAVFALLILVLVISVFSWQKGATLQQQYEDHQRQPLRK